MARPKADVEARLALRAARPKADVEARLALRAARLASRAGGRGSPIPAAHRVKTELRRSLKERLKRLSKGERGLRSRRIREALFRRRFFKNARTILFYVSLKEEVDTWSMMKRALRMQKRVLVPAIRGGRLIPSEITDLKKDLRRGSYGIFEPQGRSVRPVKTKEINLVVVPGIGFDRRGFRLGRGGGHYDRFLRNLKGRVPLVGLAFKVQRLKELPVESHDVAVDYVIDA